MIRVLVVDDSRVIRDFLAYILNRTSGIEVVGEATNGEEALEAVRLFRPDVITMDIHMPKVDGFEATRRIMEIQPTPIVIVSGSSTAKEAALPFRALEAGALTVVARPKGIGKPDYEIAANEFTQTVKLMSEVKVIRRWRHLSKRPVIVALVQKRIQPVSSEIKVVAIGGSTGAPLVLQSILVSLPRNFPIPILVVQHIATGFISGFADWLSNVATLPIRIPINGEALQPGTVYIAPDNLQMGVDGNHRIIISPEKPENGLRPAVSYLFRSLATVFGGKVIGILLSGMGKDGAAELKILKDNGAVTIVQDKESCVVFGMPGEAVKLGAVDFILPPGKIAGTLNSLANRTNTGGDLQ